MLPKYLDIDLFEGRAFTSIVPFRMNKIRFPFLPPLPFSHLLELNLRTYVKYQGVPGIYFFTLDSNHRLGNFIANKFFNLPYRFSEIKLENQNSYHCISSDLKLSAEIQCHKEESSIDKFLVDRYHLFTDNGRFIFKGQVLHDPWQLKDVSQVKFKETLNKKYGLTRTTFINAFYSSGFDVFFKPFTRVGVL